MRTKLSIIVADGTSTVGQHLVVAAVNNEKVERVVALCPKVVHRAAYETTFPGIVAVDKLQCITVDISMGLVGVPEQMKKHFSQHDAAMTCGVEFDTDPVVSRGDFKAIVLALSPNIAVVSHVVTLFAHETVRSTRTLEQSSQSSHRDAATLYRTSYWEIQSLEHVRLKTNELAKAILVDVYKSQRWAGTTKGSNTVLYQFNGNMRSVFNPKDFLSKVKSHGKETPLSAAPSRTKWHRLFVAFLVLSVVLLLADGYELEWTKIASSCSVRVPRDDGTCCGCICLKYPKMCNSTSDFDDEGNRIPFGPSNPVVRDNYSLSPVLLTLVISSIVMLLQLCTTRSTDTYMLLSLAFLVVVNVARTVYFGFENPSALTLLPSKVVLIESIVLLCLTAGVILVIWPLYRSIQETKFSRMGYTVGEQIALHRLEVSSALSIVEWQCALALYTYCNVVFDDKVLGPTASQLALVDLFACVLPMLLIPLGHFKRTVLCIVTRWVTSGLWLMFLYVLSHYRGAYVTDAIIADWFFASNRSLYISSTALQQRMDSSWLRTDLSTDFRGYYMLFLAACATFVRLLALYYTTILAYTIGSSSHRNVLMGALFDLPKEKEADIL